MRLHCNRNSAAGRSAQFHGKGIFQVYTRYRMAFRMTGIYQVYAMYMTTGIYMVYTCHMTILSYARYIPGIYHIYTEHCHISGIYQVYTININFLGFPDVNDVVINIVLTASYRFVRTMLRMPLNILVRHSRCTFQVVNIRVVGASATYRRLDVRYRRFHKIPSHVVYDVVCSKKRTTS